MNVRLLQISDSALPISGYTHSWGLEAAIARGLVHDPETLERWTAQWLRTSLGPLEGVLVASACRAALGDRADDLVALNGLAEVSIVPALDPSRQPRDGRAVARRSVPPGRGARPGSRHWSRRSEFEGWHHSVAFGLLGAIAGGETGGGADRIPSSGGARA